MHRFLTLFFSLVWLGNGLFCKVLNLVPRHEQIVSVILGHGHSRLFTLLIGLSEIVMAVWILGGYRRRLCAITQMVVVSIMNAIEFVVVPELLLWGRFNALFAFLFVLLVYFDEFVLHRGKAQV